MIVYGLFSACNTGNRKKEALHIDEQIHKQTLTLVQEIPPQLWLWKKHPIETPHPPYTQIIYYCF